VFAGLAALKDGDFAAALHAALVPGDLPGVLQALGIAVFAILSGVFVAAASAARHGDVAPNSD
jgi:hypothetical protein